MESAICQTLEHCSESEMKRTLFDTGCDGGRGYKLPLIDGGLMGTDEMVCCPFNQLLCCECVNLLLQLLSFSLIGYGARYHCVKVDMVSNAFEQVCEHLPF